MFPENLVKACIQQMVTEYETSEKNVTMPEMYYSSTNSSLPNITGIYSNFTSSSPKWNGSAYIYYVNVTRPKQILVGVQNYQDGKKLSTNVLGLVCFSIFFGIILSRMGKRGAVMHAFFISLNEVIMEMVMLIMWYSPFGICFLIIGKFLAIEDLILTAKQLGLYMATVIIGLLIHSCITLAGIFYCFTRQNPFTFFKGMLQAWVTAVGTASRYALNFHIGLSTS